MGKKCKDLQSKLDKANQEKEQAYQNQMENIQANLQNIKEQIESTNQSLIDQSIAIPQTETSSLAQGVIGRLQSPEFLNQRHIRANPMRLSSPRVPRAHSPISSVTLRSNRGIGAANEKSQERRMPRHQAVAAENKEVEPSEMSMNLGGPADPAPLFN